jgi:hypothetical protein
MPRLRYFNKHTSILPDQKPYWVVLYTTREDLWVIDEKPELRERADETFFCRGGALAALTPINDLANQIRNPPRY